MSLVRAAASALGVLAAGCGGGPPLPAPCSVAPSAYAALERGDLPAAEALAERASNCAQPAPAWEIRVLKAEILMKRRKAQEALNLLLATEPPSGASVGSRLRSLMTVGYARCYLARAAGAGRVGEADLLKAEALAAAAGAAASELKGEVWLRRGTCFTFHEDGYGIAEELFRKTLDLGAEAGLRRIEADAAGALGHLRILDSRYDDGAEWMERSRTLRTEFDPKAVDVKLLSNLGWCYTVLGDTERALPLLREAEQKADQYGYTEDHYIVLVNQGSCFLRRGELGPARAHYERALPIALGLDFHEEAREILELLQTVALRAGDPAAAQHFSERTAKLDGGGGPSAVPSLVEAELAVARRDFKGAEQLYRRIRNETKSADRRWRAQAGLARLYVATGQTREASPAFAEAQRDIEQMRRELQQDTFDFLLDSSLTEFHGAYAAFLVDRGLAAEALAVAERARGRVLWERLQPRTSRRQPPARFESVARARNAVLLSYWVGERSFVWVVTGSTTRVHELPGERELRRRVDGYHSLLAAAGDPLESPEATQLYETLVGPVADAIPKDARVIVVADGPLHGLAFDALVVPGTPKRYWLEDVVTMRTPSLALLAGVAPRAPRAERDLLLVGDALPASDAFPALPNAGQEIDAVSSHFPAAATVVLRGAQATPSGYRAAHPERFGVIHFAAHATSNRDRPLESAVVLSREGLEYKLYARDVLDLPLKADVVTVSACESAGARAYGGEGLVGFAWAFLQSGARHVVAGLWEVEDASTAQLMDHFYRGRASGLEAAAALRAAKLALVRSGGPRRKPYYWGPFVTYVQ